MTRDIRRGNLKYPVSSSVNPSVQLSGNLSGDDIRNLAGAVKKQLDPIEGKIDAIKQKVDEIDSRLAQVERKIASTGKK